MKKVLAILMVAIMLFTIAGCSNEEGDTESTKEQEASTTAEQSKEKDKKEESEKQDKEAKIGDEIKTGPYKVKINSVKPGKDFEGKPAIIVNLNWTNNGEETTSFVGSMEVQVFQDGVELEPDITSQADADKPMKEVRPGKTIEGIELPYYSTSKKPLEIEIQAIEEMFGGEPVLIKTEYPKAE